MIAARLVFLSLILLVGQSALSYDIEEVQRQIEEWGHQFTITENWVTQQDTIERMKLGGALPPANPPAEPTWRLPGPVEQRENIDWRDHNYGNYVSGIRQQGACGSCWAFASVALLESMKMISWTLPGTDPDYSEQYVLSCSGAGNCDSGNAHQALEFLSTTGTPPETCFPYEGDDGVPCESSCIEEEEYRNRIANVSYVTLDNVDVEAMKAALDFGPLVTFMQVFESFYGYDNGIYSAYGSDYTGVNHSVLVIGFDDALECWIAKNSWGTGWGEDGFFRIAYDSGCSFGFWTQAAEYRAPYGGPNWYVATDGDDVYNNGSAELPFASIVKGCNRVSSNDSVLVAPGQYSNQILSLAGRGFYLVGQGEVGGVILVGASVLSVASLEGSPEVNNFAFMGLLGSCVIFDSYPVFKKCVFSIDDLTSTPIVFGENATATFEQCSFIQCRSRLFDLVSMGEAASVQFVACIIAFNEDPLLYCDETSTVDMSCSLMWQTGHEYSGCFEGFEWINGNIWDDPQLCDVENGDYGLFLGSRCLPHHNECGIQIGAYGLQCGGDIQHVSLSGSDVDGNGSEENPYESIMWAITNSADYDTILIHPGRACNISSVNSVEAA
jgi:C1A family cysteine protease